MTPYMHHYVVEALLTAGLRDEAEPETRELFAGTLAKIDTPEAVKALAEAAIYDSVADVRLSCLDHLQTKMNGIGGGILETFFAFKTPQSAKRPARLAAQ